MDPQSAAQVPPEHTIQISMVRFQAWKKKKQTRHKHSWEGIYSIFDCLQTAWSTFSRLDAPKHTEIKMSAEIQQDDGRSYVTLTCSARCYPPAERFSWYKKAKGQERDVKMSESQTFTVFSDQPGIYYCTAKNEINERESGPVTLFVGGECCPLHLSSVRTTNPVCQIILKLCLCSQHRFHKLPLYSDHPSCYCLISLCL